MSNKTTLPPELITEETIATLFDHLQTAAETARALASAPNLTEQQRERLLRSWDGWHYCSKVMLSGITPHRER